LHRKRTRSALQRLPHQRQRFSDLSLMPAAAILLFENNQIAGFIETGIAPCIVKEHEVHQTSY